MPESQLPALHPQTTPAFRTAGTPAARPPPLFRSPHPRTKKGGPASPPFSYLVSRRYFMRNFMGSMDSEGKNRSRNSTSISTIRKGAMFRTRLPILMFPMPQTT